ncbi:MAG: type II CAAX prenyl endopeptidase Rce1 family protein [Pseudomonadales bacterium]
MEALIFSLAFAGIAFAVFLTARVFDRTTTFALAGGCAIYLGLDDLVTGLASSSGAFAIVDGNWNWTGKIYSILLSAGMIIALRIRPESVGLRLEQNAPRLALVAVAGFTVWGASLGLLFQPGAPDAETLVFQALMPGTAEEMVYRGIAPAILMGLIHGKQVPDRMPWAVIMATAILFAVWHGLGYAAGAFDFDVLSALFPFVGSVVGGWLRFKTGSLLVPVPGHSFANVAFHLAGAVSS